MLTFADALALGKSVLSQESAALDAELLLAHVMQVSRSHIYAWPQKTLNAEQESEFRALLQRAHQGEPVAYLVQQKEFWSLPLRVTPATLIPRPETELIVEIVLEKFSTHRVLTVLDLGTGSGAIALALASEKPEWEIIATDISVDALAVAQDNAKRLQLANVQFLQSDWYSALPCAKKFDVIVSNPPYIAEDDAACEKAVREYEPAHALFSAEKGLADIAKIISQSKERLSKNGLLVLEHGFQQGSQVADLFEQNDYKNIRLYQDLTGQNRVTIGYTP